MRNAFTMLALLACAVAIPRLAQASLQAGDLISFTQNGNGNGGGGGEFDARVTGWNAQDVDFVTFCIEIGQHINNGTVYEVHSVYENSITGANGGQGVDPVYGPLLSDPVSKEMAWLFLQFWNEVQLGETSALNYLTSNTRGANANTLQYAFWQLEGESVGQTTANNSYLNLAVNTATDTEKNYALSRVRAINPIVKGSDGTDPNNHKQSMLYVIPEATTIVIWSVLGMIGVVGGRRRRPA
jgi:hypothetical protein